MDALSRRTKAVKPEKLFKELGLKSMSEFVKGLNSLENQGQIVISKNGNITAVGSGKLSKGVVISMSRHFAFVRPETGSDDVYISGEHLGGALPGDRVVISAHQDAKGCSGKVVKIIERSSHLVTGTVGKYHGKSEFHADEQYKKPIKITSNKKKASVGDKVMAKVSISKGGELSCTVEKIYGNSECARICANAIIDELGIPSRFSSEVLQEADEISSHGISAKDIKGRLDLRGEKIFTIDGADAKDLDDAICVKKTPSGFELSVHIADVSHYIKSGSLPDIEAQKRGTSVYFADRVIPMYPESISNGICSLNAHTDKLAFSVIINLDKNGIMQHYKFVKTIINSRVRGVYSEVNSLLDGSASREIVEKYSPVSDEIKAAHELYLLLKNNADKRGSIHFASVEPCFELDENGVCSNLSVRETGEAEKMIEQFMISANVAAAKLAREENLPFVYRVHEPPSQDSLENAAQLLSSIGLNVSALRKNPSPSDIDKIMLSAVGTKYEQVVSNVLLRAMSKAHYDSASGEHFGLSLEDYCHFTSPIRRYPDSFIHRVLSAYVSGKSTKSFKNAASDAAALSSEFELRAMNAERRAESCYMAEYMLRFVGDEFDGTICSVLENGFFVRLENGAEGYVRIESLPPDQYSFDGFASLRGMTNGKSYAVGDRIRIRMEAANVSAGKVDFSPEE